MTQPTFVPVSSSGAVRASMTTKTPEIGRAKKAGLLGAPGSATGAGHGTTGPDAGFALTLAARAVHGLVLSNGESTHDLEVGVAALASKRAALAGRGPSKSDVEVVLDLFGLRLADVEDVVADRRRRFSGLAHSYFHQRAFVDAVPEAALSQSPGAVIPLLFFHS